MLLSYWSAMRVAARFLFILFFLLSFSGWISPPVALTLGILFGLIFTHPYETQGRTAARFLLQAAVVALGFGMNLHEVLKAGRSGFVYTALGISFALVAGLLLGRILNVGKNSSFLITSGTAICGGSAIAAIGPVLHADDEEMAVSLATIFVLNSLALLIFPAIGGALHLSQSQFGLWAALAIHDTSSVVGASAKYGTQALVIGTTVKLTRALWIVPLALATAFFVRPRDQKDDAGGKSEGMKLPVSIPWFILLFCLAAVVNTYFPSWSHLTKSLFALGRRGLTATLFLIGTGITRATLRTVGWRPLLQGVLLWAVVAVTSLYFIRIGIISL
jgi:uncharacterized integral membrane protein (TIGR00698 family)